MMPPRSKNHGTGRAQSVQPEQETPGKRETRGSKRKAAQDPEENSVNGMDDSASDGDEPPATPQNEKRSPRKVRKFRANSDAASETQSLIVKLKIRVSNDRGKLAGIAKTSRIGLGAKRRRDESPFELPSPTENGEDDDLLDAENPSVQIVASTPSSPASPPDSYPVYDEESPDSKTGWKEPRVVKYYVHNRSDPKRMTTSPVVHKALEYVMGSKDTPYDNLGDARRKLLTKSRNNDDTDGTTVVTTTVKRGGTRGRGRGGRGRAGRLMTSREAPEESEVMAPVSGRGRGGYRVKKSENPRIQSMYHRRAALRHHYKAIANLQRAALEALAEKSLETLKSDPEAHARLPAFDKVGRGLGECFDTLVNTTEAKLRIHREFLEKKRENDFQYEEIRKRCAAQDLYDDVIAEFFMSAEHILNEYGFNYGESGPRALIFKNKEDGEEQFIRIEEPRKVVALEATPAFRAGDFEAIVGDDIPTVGDTEFEQHPANYRMVDPDVREAHEAAMRDERAHHRSKKSGRSTKTLLGSSAAPAQFEVLESQDIDNDSTVDSDTGPAEILDKYGVKFPKKQAPKNGSAPNNRFVVDRHFDYEEYEIGNRCVKMKRTNTGEPVYMGKDAFPNPKNFYFDQKANGYNAGRNKPDDLDAATVELFGLHPAFGLAVNGSRNLNYEEYVDIFSAAQAEAQEVLKPRSDWKQPLVPTQPKIFIEEKRGYDPTRLTDDRFKRIFRTSRSEHHMRFAQIFEERPDKDKIESLLKHLWPEYWEARQRSLEPSPVSSVSPSPPPTTSNFQVRDIEEDYAAFFSIAAAAKQFEADEEARIARVRASETRTRRAFDPVRDISPPPPPPEDRSNLLLLAGIATVSRLSVPATQPQPPPQSLPPQTMQTQYHPFTSGRNWPPPFPWPRSQQQQSSPSQGHSHNLSHSQAQLPSVRRQENMPHGSNISPYANPGMMRGGPAAPALGPQQSALRPLLPAPQQGSNAPGSSSSSQGPRYSY